MKKWRYSIGMKAAAAAAVQAFAVMFVICLMILVVLFQNNILNFSEKRDTSFETSSYFTRSEERRVGKECYS